MSVLNQSGEEQVECPLCMEALEVDDLNFFPCTCGYQICRFCWHRIRTDENGLCPACRKAYSENPADFTPLSKEQVAQIKAEKRQRDQQRKAKLSENRKHLANVRVVQKNLVFVVGLPLRLADAELLKKHEYFGKFGKIHKVVINQSTSYAGSQGPSASAYVTYMKSDDALRAIQSVNNIQIDGRLLKSSLGTTKYCSHFMKNQPCPKPDCMYLHDFDPKASFTKEQMHAGKHQEYERELHSILEAKMQSAQQQNENKPSGKNKESTTTTTATVTTTTTVTSGNTCKETWPQLNSDKADKNDKKTDKDKVTKVKSKLKISPDCIGKKPEKVKNTDSLGKNQEVNCKNEKLSEENIQSTARSKEGTEAEKVEKTECNLPKIPILDDNSSFFSQNTFQKIAPEIEEEDNNLLLENSESQNQILNDSLPNINSSEDWEAAFGFSKQNNHMEELAKQRNNVKDTLETFGNGFDSLDMFGTLDNYHQNSYNNSNKLQENILEAMSNKHTHIGPQITPQITPHYSKSDRLNSQFGIGSHELNGLNGLNNTLDQQMSKFFSEFCKNGQSSISNSLNGLSQSNGYVHNFTEHSLYLLRQRQLEDQLMSFSLKQPSFNQQLLHNSLHNNQFLNGDILAQNGQSFGTLHNQLYQNSTSRVKSSSRPDDELDFDPFHETQKGLAELLENEHKIHSTGRTTNQINGLVHNQTPTNQILPPPPGFMQSNTTHMNSFGSKILPFLSMGNSQQHQIGNNTQNNWSGNYSQVQQHSKGLSACNDWKVLDPAIVSSSKHFLLANMQQPREHYNNLQQLPSQQLQNGPVRSFDYPNFSNYNPQIQSNYNNISHINNQHNLNWLGNDLNSQIASPPGFRATNQATKQQEC